jgi:hypothetical protein
VFKKGMYTLINDGIKKCLITVIHNVQNFGKCLSFNVSSVADANQNKIFFAKTVNGPWLQKEDQLRPDWHCRPYP